MKIQKPIFIIFLVAGLLGGSFASAQSLTLKELQSLVADLQVQIDQLLQQIQDIDEGTSKTSFCYDFQNSLREGNRGDDVTALQTAMQEDGVYTGPITGYFGNLTRAGVVEFQEKYSEEILRPFDITEGTGFVGATTRAQLNTLFECKKEIVIIVGEPSEVTEEPAEEVVEEEPQAEDPSEPVEPVGDSTESEVVEEVDLTPSLTLISPNGGETWDIGKEYSIEWVSENVSQVEIQLYRNGLLSETLAVTDAEAGTYGWTILSGFKLASDYTIRVVDEGNAELFDESTDTFETSIDTAVPVLSNGNPTGTIAAGTLETLILLDTDERAICRYSTKTSKDYYSMIDTFDTTDAFSHSTLVTGLRNGNAYAYYVKCLDVRGNRNFNDFKIDFQVGN